MASIGPFPSFVFPGVYTETLNEAPRVTAAGGLRVPAFVGVADEVIPVTAYEMIRGSSSMADNLVVKEEMISSLTYPIDGSNRNFRVTMYPIVTGQGTGTTTTDPNNVKAYVNSESVPIATVTGATGIVTLVTAPATGDLVEISYYYKRNDTLVTDEDISIQADGSNTTFKVQNVPIVDGSNGGIITTDITKVTVKVNAVAVTVSAVDGADGIITLASAPGAGTLVQVTYYYNTYQNTYDILPSHNVSSITRIGLSPSTTDFVNETDYVLDTTGAFDTINWGNSVIKGYGTNTFGSTYFYSQVSTTLVDNRIYKRPVTGTVDGTNKTFTLPDVPTNGSGTGRATDATSLILAYVGSAPNDTTQVAILEMDSAGQTMTLATAPGASKHVYVTQYQNILTDDVWTLTNLHAGATDGTYTIGGENAGSAMEVLYSTASVTSPNFGTEGVRYPAGASTNNNQFSDAQVIPGYGVAETITLTFTQLAGDSSADVHGYIVSSSNSSGTGSLGDNTGYLGQTYIDNKTGFRITILRGNTYGYANTDTLAYTVSASFITPSNPTRAIPGLRLYVTDTTGVTVNDTGIVNTYNKSGNEPNIGDFYYVTFNDTKQFNSSSYIDPVAVTTEKDALAYTGPLSVNNKLALAAHMAFLNGAPAVILLQVQKTTGGSDAPDSRYITAIDVFNSPMEGGLRPALMQPVSTSSGVLAYTKTSNIIQSSIRSANERMTYFGFATGTTPSSAMSFAQATNSERMTGIYPDGAVVVLTDELGNNQEFLVDGSLLAAAISGRDTSPAFDVAEPLTRKPVVGFSRLYRRLDTVTQSQVANSGVTILEETSAGINVKIDLTTDVTSVLTRTPSVIRIKDYVQKGVRSALDPYIGMKFLPSRTTEIVTTVKSYFSSLLKAQIITAFTGVTAVPDPVDPTTIRVTASYSPVLPLLWIVVTFNLRTSI
jgi:hypothetical protein